MSGRLGRAGSPTCASGPFGRATSAAAEAVTGTAGLLLCVLWRSLLCQSADDDGVDTVKTDEVSAQ